MTVTTRFNAGEKVFYINSNGKIEDSVIRTVQVKQVVNNDGTTSIQVLYQLTAWRMNMRSRVNKLENELYSSMEELINSLTTDYTERNENIG